MSTKSSYARAELAVGRRRFEIFRLDALQSGISLGAFAGLKIIALPRTAQGGGRGAPNSL